MGANQAATVRGALETGEQTPPDEGSDALVTNSLGPQIAQNFIQAGVQNNGSPRDWAENAVSAVTSALAGFGAAGKVPPGAGALYGVGAAARQGQERQDKLRQQNIENQRAQQTQMTQQQVAAAQIAHLNADTYNIERASRNADRETMQKLVDSDIAASQPYLDGGIQSFGEHLTSDDLQRMLKPGTNGKSEINGHEVLPFKDGLTDLIGPDGRPVLNQEGLPVQRPTYRLFDAKGQVTLDDAQAKFIADNTSYHPQAGTPMDVTAAATLQNMAKKNQMVSLNIDKIKAETAKDQSEADKAADESKDKTADNRLKQQAAQLFTPYLSAADGDPWKAIQMMGKDPKNASALGIIEQAYGPGNIQAWHEKQEEFAEKEREDRFKEQSTADYSGDPNAATPQQFLQSLGPQEQATIKMIGEGRVPLNSPTYLLARKPEIMDAVAKAYPGFDASKVKSYQETYEDFTRGKTSIALNSGGTALQHLAELKAINDANPEQVRIPGTKPNQAYQNKVDTVAAELARFYGTDTVSGIASIKATLDPINPFASRDTAITTQATSMGDKLDSFEQQWRNAAPSPAYQAPMPGISDAAKIARATLTGVLTATGPNGQKLILQNGRWVPPTASGQNPNPQ